jgi:hypothetical protein
MIARSAGVELGETMRAVRSVGERSRVRAASGSAALVP